MSRLILFCVMLLVAAPALAAFSSAMAWDVRTTATAGDANAGGFRNGGAVATPSAPSVSCPTTGGTVAANTYYVCVTYVDGRGREGPCSAATSVVCTGATSRIVTTSPAASSGVFLYHVYMGTANLPGPWFANPGTDVAIGTDSSRTTTPATTGTQPCGTDYSQQNASQISYTDINEVSTTTWTSAGNPFTPAHVCNTVNLTAGTNCTVARYEITAVSATNVATVDKASGTGTACTGVLGGSLLTLSKAATLVVAGNNVYAKDGTYSETLTIAVSGGAGTPITWSGYATSHGDAPTGATRPLIDAASTRANCIVSTASVDANIVQWFRLSGGTGSNVVSSGSSSGNTMGFVGVKSSSSAVDGFALAQPTFYVNCEAASNTGKGFNVATNCHSYMWGCEAHDNGALGVGWGQNDANGSSVAFTLSYANAGVGFQVAEGFFRMMYNTSKSNTGASSDGFNFATGNGRSWPVLMAIGNISASNGRDGFRRAGTSQMSFGFFDYNDYYGNSGVPLTNILAGKNDSTADPTFTSATDLSIGTNLKALGFPGVFPRGTSTGYLDIGAVQRVEPAGGSGGISRARVVNSGGGR